MYHGRSHRVSLLVARPGNYRLLDALIGSVGSLNGPGAGMLWINHTLSADC